MNSSSIVPLPMHDDSGAQVPKQDWIWIRDREIQTLDLVPVYDVFSRFSLPPGLVTCDLDCALQGDIDGLPTPIGGVYREILRAAVDELDVCVGSFRVECWTNRAWEVRSEVEYHVDNDEILRRRTGSVVMPDRGLIFYAGPDEQEAGGTYFNPPIEGAADDKDLFCNPLFDDVATDMGRFVPFLPGRLVLFDGRCPHCVVPFNRLVSPRVTLLANFWHCEQTASS